MWKTLAKALVSTGKGAISAGLWASQHPEVLAQVATIAKLPGVLGTIAAVSDGARTDTQGRTIEGP